MDIEPTELAGIERLDAVLFARGFSVTSATVLRQALYPKEQYALGHPDLAFSVNSLGDLLADQGAYGEARAYYERALGMFQALYPKAQFPQGHPSLADSLANLGALFHAQRADAEARPVLQQAVDMQQDLADILLAATSEAESRNYLAQLPVTRDLLISASLHLPGSDDSTYARVWRGKAALTRVLRQRQAALFPLATLDLATRHNLEAWRDTRSQLARSMLATADGRDHPERLQQLQQLTADKERLERQLAGAIPEFGRKKALEKSPHTKLAQALPEHTVVLDLVHHWRFEQDPQVKGKKGERWTPNYIGYVLAKGRPVQQVDLGLAQPIHEAADSWRRAIAARQPSPAAESLRRLVWEPLAKQVPRDTNTVIIAPDGRLTAIPWAALPGDRPGTVLLEQYALATVPHAPFLLDRLTAPTRKADDRDVLLAVGGVAYDQAPKPIDDEKTRIDLLASRLAETERGRGDGWQELPGTLQELNAVVRLAGPRTLVRLQGAEAGTARVLRDLPRARWAHIATHGFFADPSVPSVLRPDPKLFASIGR
ncbi:MAG: CHAT domain-containing protein, partial [Capsulimonadaceae bacterium]